MAAPPLLGKHQRQASSPLLEFSGNVTVELTIVALEINVATVPTYRKEKELELEAHFKNVVLFVKRQPVDSVALSTWNHTASLSASDLEDLIVFHVNGEPRLSGAVSIKDLLVDLVNEDLKSPKWVLLNLRNKPDAQPGAVQVRFVVKTDSVPIVIAPSQAAGGAGGSADLDPVASQMLERGVAHISLDQTERRLRHSDLPEPLDLLAIMNQPALWASSSSGLSTDSNGAAATTVAATASSLDVGTTMKTKKKTKANGFSSKTEVRRPSKGAAPADAGPAHFATIAGHGISDREPSTDLSKELNRAPPRAKTAMAGAGASDARASTASAADFASFASNESVAPLMAADKKRKSKKPATASDAAPGPDAAPAGAPQPAEGAAVASAAKSPKPAKAKKTAATAAAVAGPDAAGGAARSGAAAAGTETESG